MKEQKKIVLIDDDDDDWLLFREAIRRIDQNLIHHYFQDAVEAIHALAKYPKEDLPHYIFVDLNMPRMNGKEFLLEIKGRTELAHIPVIVLSTSDHEEDIRQAKLFGALYFVTKPYKLALLEAALRFVITGNANALPCELGRWVKLL